MTLGASVASVMNTDAKRETRRKTDRQRERENMHLKANRQTNRINKI